MSNETRVAVYTRTARADAVSIERQLAAVRYEVARAFTDARVVAEISEDGRTHTAGQSLTALIETGAVDVIAVAGLDRLSRRAGDLLTILKACEACGVAVLAGSDLTDFRDASDIVRSLTLGVLGDTAAEVRRNAAAAVVESDGESA
jgi:DNA invertase Pin-like site-specific DNA recombinase